jgi:peroxiredoxin
MVWVDGQYWFCRYCAGSRQTISLLQIGCIPANDFSGSFRDSIVACQVVSRSGFNEFGKGTALAVPFRAAKNAGFSRRGAFSTVAVDFLKPVPWGFVATLTPGNPKPFVEEAMRYESLMPDLGSQAPDFALPDPGGRIYTLKDFSSGRALLVAFLCNHCPFVQHLLDGFVSFASEYAPKGLATVAISSNDVGTYPEDAPEKMAELAATRGFTFSYLYDESQEVAKAFGAACTPDFFLYDASRRLYYRGQFDNSRPQTVHTPGPPIPVTGADMRAAVEAALAGRPAPAEQMPSRGCSLKWKPGNEPFWG